MKVYITGIGIVSPLGIGREKTWENILKTKDVEHLIPKNWHTYRKFSSNIWAPLPNVNYSEEGFTNRDLLQYDETSLLALMSAKEAFEHSGIDTTLINKKRRQYEIQHTDNEKIAVVYGTGSGGANSCFESYSYHINSKIKEELGALPLKEDITDRIYHPSSFNPMAISRTICNSVPAGLGIKYCAHGEVRPIVQACSSGTAAIGDAYKLIKDGKYDMVISGGAEQLGDDCGGFFCGFDVARTLTTNIDNRDIHKQNRPFDNERNGFLFAQGGACTVILESEKSINNRQGEPLVEVCGYEEAFEAYSLVAQDQSGHQIERTLDRLLNNSNISPEQIDYINAHGTGTKSNDQVESKVIEKIFGNKVAVNSTKSIIGHTLGASGAIEAAVCALSIRDETLHTSKNLNNPISDLDFVTEVRKKKVTYAITESFAFGGHISCLLLKKP